MRLLDEPCALCARSKDISDYKYCSSCCYAMAMSHETKEYPDGVDNLMAWVASKLGVGTLPAASVIMLELTLSHLMHHPVILPSSIGHDMIEMAIRQARTAKDVTIKNGKGVLKTIAKIRRAIPERF